MRRIALAAMLAGTAFSLACSDSGSPTDPLAQDDAGVASHKGGGGSDDGYGYGYGNGDDDACRLDDVIQVVVAYQGTNYPHTYVISRSTGGGFTGASTDGTEQVTGSLVGTAFRLTSRYTSGYSYTITGTVDPATGIASGIGTSSTGQQFTFTTDDIADCQRDDDDDDDEDCPDAPSIATHYLKSLGLKNRIGDVNVVSRVAQQTDDDGTFMGLEPCDPGYEAAVLSFVNQLLAQLGVRP